MSAAATLLPQAHHTGGAQVAPGRTGLKFKTCTSRKLDTGNFAMKQAFGSAVVKRVEWERNKQACWHGNCETQEPDYLHSKQSRFRVSS